MDKKRFAILISGYGRGAIQILLDNEFGFIKPTLSLVLSSNPDSGALNFAKEFAVPAEFVDKKRFKNRNEFEVEIIKMLEKYKIDFIFLAGWNYILTSSFIKKYDRRIVNIHPSILPYFQGTNAITQAIESKVKFTGITTHFVDEGIDTGEIIDQKIVYIDNNEDFDKLDFKIFKQGAILSVNTINEIFK
jgi:phosphoribosylglycinamide formyltransferase 1